MRQSPKKGLESVSNFIEKTYRILESDQYNDIIDWTYMGCSFIIKDIKKFEEVVLPIHFKHSNFSSFVRQLNMYNFHKVRGDRHDCQFQHEKFKKGRRDLLPKIKRKQSQVLIMSHNTIQQPIMNFPCLSDQSAEGKKFSEMDGIFHDNQQQTQMNKLQELRKINKNLKQLKHQKLQKQKTLSSINFQEMGQKFFKLITSLLAVKIKKQMGLDIVQYQPIQIQGSSFDSLIDHIVDNQIPLNFNNYNHTATKISQKQNHYDFMIQR